MLDNIIGILESSIGLKKVFRGGYLVLDWWENKGLYFMNIVSEG